jgi:hypothetical protein
MERIMKSESFETHPKPKRSELKRELRRLILAHSDIDSCVYACKLLLNVIRPELSRHTGDYAGMDHPMYPPLIDAITISYARPFVSNDGVGVLKGKWTRFANEKRKHAHDLMIQTRHELTAHSDKEIRTVEIVPGEKGARGYRIKRYNLSLSTVESCKEHARILARDLQKEIERLLEGLYGGMDIPQQRFELKENEGL